MPITPIFPDSLSCRNRFTTCQLRLTPPARSSGSSLHDPATELVAKFMVELAQTGVHDYEPLLAATLERFGHSDCRTCQLASR